MSRLASKTDAEEAVREAKAGGFAEFYPAGYEPGAGLK